MRARRIWFLAFGAMLLGIGAFLDTRASGQTGEVPMTCDNKCRLRFDHQFSDGDCRSFSLETCTFCQPALKVRCLPRADDILTSLPCNNVGSNFLRKMETCTPVCPFDPGVTTVEAKGAASQIDIVGAWQQKCVP